MLWRKGRGRWGDGEGNGDGGWKMGDGEGRKDNKIKRRQLQDERIESTAIV